MKDLKALGVCLLLAVVTLVLWQPDMVRAVGGAFAIAGTFSNSAHSFGVDSTVNSCDNGADFQASQGSNYQAAAVGGCVAVPSSSTVYGAAGVQGSVRNASIDTNGVGGFFPAYADGNGTDGDADSHRVRVWGINPLVSDRGFSHVLLMNEFDYNVTGTDTKVIGISAVGASTHAPAAGSAYSVLGPIGAGGIHFPYGWMCADNGSDVCFQLGATSTAANSNSQIQRFIARDSSNAVQTVDVSEGSGGGFFINMSASGGAVRFRHGGVDSTVINGDGGVNPLGLPLASLGAPANFTIKGCTDCVAGSNPCTIGGSGAIAKRLGGAWDCR